MPEEYDGREKIFVTIPHDAAVGYQITEVAKRHKLFHFDSTPVSLIPRRDRIEYRLTKLVDPRTYEQEWKDAGAIKVEYYTAPNP